MPAASTRRPSSLVLEEVTVRFGGLTVLENLSLSFGHSPISSLIGANGAGKTTVFNVFCGIVVPVSGRLIHDGKDITRLAPVKVVRRGIVRKFQVPTVFNGLSVADNLRVAAQAPRDHAVSAEQGQVISPQEVAEQFGLAPKLRVTAGELAHGERQWLEIAMAFLGRPRFLLLDEPAAGLGPEESMLTATLIKTVSQYCNTIVIEHDMSFVRELGGDVTVLHQGRLLRQGTMEEIEADMTVRDVYLGRETHA